jgi:hypothetical protein
MAAGIAAAVVAGGVGVAAVTDGAAAGGGGGADPQAAETNEAKATRHGRVRMPLSSAPSSRREEKSAAPAVQ